MLNFELPAIPVVSYQMYMSKQKEQLLYTKWSGSFHIAGNNYQLTNFISVHYNVNLIVWINSPIACNIFYMKIIYQ